MVRCSVPVQPGALLCSNTGVCLSAVSMHMVDMNWDDRLRRLLLWWRTQMRHTVYMPVGRPKRQHATAKTFKLVTLLLLKLNLCASQLAHSETCSADCYQEALQLKHSKKQDSQHTHWRHEREKRFALRCHRPMSGLQCWLHSSTYTHTSCARR